MKTKIITLSQSTMVFGAVASLCLASAAQAQNPSQYKHPSAATRAEAGATGEKNATASKLSAKDKTFMMNAAKGGMMEVEWGKLAAEKGENPDVKKFGNRMVTDHSKANDELKSLAAGQGVKLPASGPSAKWKSDKAYMGDMVKDHEKDLAEFQAEARDGSDPDLKKFADKYSKVVEKHLDMAKEIDGKLK